MKKLLGCVLAALTLAVSAFALAACDFDFSDWGSGNDHYHTLVRHDEKKPTCTDEGNILYWECTGCGKLYDDLAAAYPVQYRDVILQPTSTGHTKGEFFPGRSATCTEDGERAHHVCTECGAFVSEEGETITEADLIIPAAHTPVEVKGYAATCNETGLTDGVKCSVCETMLVEQKQIGALGHDLKEVPEVPATCTAPGKQAGKVCSRGDYTEGFGEIEALGHKGGTATCTQLAVCEVCHEAYGELEAHKYDAQVAEAEYLATEATCVDLATYYYSCSVCGEKDPSNRTFAAGDYAAHKYDAQVAETEYLATEATCVDLATYYYSCSVCGEKDPSDRTFTAGEHAAHKYDGQLAEEKYLASEATCMVRATYYYSCSVCGEKDPAENTFETGDYAAHRTEFHERVAPTWAADGVKEYYECTVCRNLFADEKGTQETTLDALRIAREAAPETGLPFDIVKDSSTTLDPLTAANWKTFSSKGSYGGSNAAPTRKDDHLEFTAASRFEMLWMNIAGNYVHLGGGDAYWKQGTGTENGGNAVPYYGQQFLYTLTVGANGAFDLELFGMMNSTPDYADEVQKGWYFRFEGDTVTLYLRASNNNSDLSKNVLWASAKLEGMNFGSGTQYNVAFAISRDSFDDYSVSLYVEGYKVVFEVAGEHEGVTNYLTVKDGTLLVHDSNAHFGQRLSVIPLALESGYTTVNLYGLNALMVDGYITPPAYGEKVDTTAIDGKNFFNPDDWAFENDDKFAADDYGGTLGVPEFVSDDSGSYLNFEKVASRFRLFMAPVGSNWANLGDGNTWKEANAGGPARGQKYLYTMSVLSSGPYDLEIFGMNGSLLDRSNTSAQSGMYFNFEGNTVRLYFRDSSENKGGIVLWATANLSSSVTDGEQHEIAFSISRSTRYHYMIMLYVDGVKVEFVKEAARTATYFDINGVHLLFRGTNTISLGQRLSVIPRANEEGTYSTVRIYSLDIYKVGAVDAAQYALPATADVPSKGKED